ncbi:MAG TPA: glucodextranase DOMON-like domain-containing protein [Trebonia sp.]
MKLPVQVRRHARGYRRTAAAAGVAALLAGLGLAVPNASAATTASASTAATAAASVAPGGPGTDSYFDLARKDCVGTAENTGSKVWYTVADGVLSDVYEPTIDNTNVSTLQYVVTDGATFTDLQTRDMTYTVSADSSGMACTVTSTDAAHGFRLVTTYVTDPNSEAVLMHTTLEATPGSTANLASLHLYARLDAHVNGNGGGGSQNAGANTGVVDTSTGTPVPVMDSTNTVTNATNRDYAVPTYMALAASTPVTAASVGYAGTVSDGLTELDTTRALSPAYDSAPDGHIVSTAQLTPDKKGELTLALGFGRTQAGSVSAATGSLRLPFAQAEHTYQAGWAAYDGTLRTPPGHYPGLPPSQAKALRNHYYLDANVLKASEDKTYPGAVVASLASPWGQAVPADTFSNGEPSYFGSYREVFARDLYEAFTGLLADGDVATARNAALFLFDRQQLPDGSMPRNSLLNGKTAPDTGGTQLDEAAYPILMALESGLGGDTALYENHIRPAADFLVSHGPSFGVERWEEQSGYSPSTIAAEIAGLTAAAAIAKQHGDTARANVYQATADDFQRGIKAWTVTTTGQDAARYFIRLSKTGDPNAAITYNLGNGGPTVDQRSVIDGGFQELVRLGELPVTDPDVQASLNVLDKQISVATPSGTGYYRYGTSAAAGSADGYGDCFQPSQTTCATTGAPWPPTDTGTGHLWPVLSGERAESDVAEGNAHGAAGLLSSMINFSSGVGLVPEQAWEDPNLPASPYGSDPATASIGFTDGKAAGSASPLTWAQSQELRLILSLGTGSVVDTPAVTTQRYVAHGAPGELPVTISSPAAGATLAVTSTTVTGTTAPKAGVTIETADATTGALATVTSTVAAADGSFSATVPVSFGSNVITVAATAAGGRQTGYAQVAVTNEGGGTAVLDLPDQAGNGVGTDTGPGTYQYPTASDFHAGAFKINRFQVLSDGTYTYVRTTLADLTPTFGQVDGAQLLDVFVHVPGAPATSTAAPFPSRNYSIASSGAWSQRVEVQGFASPVWVNASGASVGTPLVLANQADKTITIALPEAQFGTPASGWAFSVVLTGQDGFSGDQARAFTQYPGSFSFGICPAGDTAPICEVDPGTVPKAMDVITPAGVSQADELNPLNGPVVIQPVTVP